jgi:hypothetical protein
VTHRHGLRFQRGSASGTVDLIAAGLPGGGGGDNGVRRSTTSTWVVVAALIGDRRAARARLEAVGAAEVQAQLRWPGGVVFEFIGTR